MDKVVIYDQENEIVGETFQRRAKQLVLKGRATWLNDNKGIKLTPEVLKEDKMQTNDFIDLRETAEETPTTAPQTLSDDLLMYLAKRNIRKRWELIGHIAACGISFPAVFILTSGFAWNGWMPWQFYAGVYATWGIFIAHKMFVFAHEWLSRRKPAKDALKAEYERLKSAPPKVDL